MSTTPLDTNFKDDILASSNAKRKYQMTYNDDGTVSFQDVTAYSQMGSAFGAKEVNEERAAINKINSDRIVTLDEIDLVTEPGFFVDAMAVKELNRNFKESVYADGYMVVDIGALPNNSTKSVPANIPSASEYWISDAWCKSRTTGQVSPMPYIDASTWSNAIGITISASKNIVVTTKADWSAYSGKAIIAYKL